MQHYSGIQKFLHDFVLSKKFINKSLFEIEKLIYLKNEDIKKYTCICNWVTKIRNNKYFKFYTFNRPICFINV